MLLLLTFQLALKNCRGFSSATTTTTKQTAPLFAVPSEECLNVSRRRCIQQSAAVALAPFFLRTPAPALAAERLPLEDLLYTILRVREATQQETRLIKSGKFKDVQRANVKLAVKFMIENYKLNDALLAASNYLDSNNKRMAAVNIGQTAVQDLYTILEYFDSSDVQNLKVRWRRISAVVHRCLFFYLLTILYYILDDQTNKK